MVVVAAAARATAVAATHSIVDCNSRHYHHHSCCNSARRNQHRGKLQDTNLFATASSPDRSCLPSPRNYRSSAESDDRARRGNRSGESGGGDGGGGKRGRGNGGGDGGGGEGGGGKGGGESGGGLGGGGEGGGEGGCGEGGGEGGGGFPETVVASDESMSHPIFAGAVPVALTRGCRLWRRTGIGTPRVKAPTTSMHRNVTEGKARGCTPLAFGWTMFSGSWVVCGAHGREGLESSRREGKSCLR
eukprot:scaffold54948_cov49-Phaeocystis_antarctica.AAC.1